METNRFDLAGLADTGYHIGDDGVALLNEMIISNCGYKSFHVDHPEDVLLCFQEIVNLHRLVVQTWTNTCTYFSGPVVEYIIEKALPVFPRLLDLDVSGTVKFTTGSKRFRCDTSFRLCHSIPSRWFLVMRVSAHLAWTLLIILLLHLPGWMCSLIFSLKRNPRSSQLYFLWVSILTMDSTLCGGSWNSQCRDSSL